MKKLLAISLIVALLAAVGMGIHLTTLDGLDGLIWSSMFEEDTVYAPNYSGPAFRKVTIGMPESEVKDLLGAPLSRWNRDENGIVWCYTDSPNDSHYRIRQVTIRSGAVVGKHAEFYVD